MKTQSWSHFFLLCVWLVPISATSAQTQTEEPTDTLQWQRYYPLAVGNVWEYHDAEASDHLTRYEIIGDTLVGDRLYFRRRVDVRFLSSPYPEFAPSFDFLRYDEGGGVVIVSSPAADTVGLLTCASNGFERDLRLSFGASIACPSVPDRPEWADSARVDGVYDAEWAPSVLSGMASPTRVAAIKYYTVGGVLFTTFVSDIGPIWTGNLAGPVLHYARIGGAEYGRAELAVSVEPAEQGLRDLHVRALRNPVQDQAIFDVSSSDAQFGRWKVVDMLGRAVLTGELALEPGGKQLVLETGRLSAGLYHLMVQVDADAARASFVVVR